MKTKRSIFNSAALSGAAVVFACLTGMNLSAQAQAFYWTGNSGTDYNLNTGGNWVGNVAPGFGWDPILTFGNNVVNGTVDMPFGYLDNSIVVASGCTTNITFNGSGKMILGNGGLVQLAADGKNLTFNSPIGNAGWDGILNFDVGTGRTLTVNGGIIGNDWGPGSWATIVKNGAGTGVITTAASGFYQINGLTINAGTLQLGDGTSGRDGSLPTSITTVNNNAALVYNLYGNQTNGPAISGTGTLTKNGAGTLTLTSTSVLSGGTTVNGGTLVTPDGDWQLGNPWGVGGMDGAITVNAGTTLSMSAGASAIKNGLTLNGGTVSSRGLSYPGSGNWGNLYLQGWSTISAGGSAVSTISSALNMSTTNTFFVDTGSTLNVTGTVYNGPGGAGSLTKTGNGTLAFSGAIGFTGGITVNAGTLQMPSGSWNLNAIANYPITVNAGATLQLPAEPSQYNVAPTLNGGTITSIGDNTSGWPNISLSPGVTMTAGGATVSTISTWVGFSGNGIFSVGSGSTLNITGRLTGDWIEPRTGLFKTGDGTLTLSNAANNYDCDTTISAGTLAIGGAGTLNIGNYTYNIVNNGAFVYGSSAAQTLSGIISGTGSLTQNGLGTLTLSGANTYTNTTTVNGGTLTLSGASANLSASSAVTVASGGHLHFQPSGDSGTYNYNSFNMNLTGQGAGNFQLEGSATVFFGGNNWNTYNLGGNVTVAGGVNFSAYGGANTINLGGIFSGTGDMSFASQGVAWHHVVFSGDSSASGYTGTYKFYSNDSATFAKLSGGDNRLAITATVDLESEYTGVDYVIPAVLDLNGYSQELAGLVAGANPGNCWVQNSGAGTPVLTINNVVEKTFTGQLGTGGTSFALTKKGAGTLTLTGTNNTYSGGTTVQGGTLLVNNTAGSGTGSGSVTVQNNATLSGTGSISGDITVQSGGMLSGMGSFSNVTFEADASVFFTTNSTQNMTFNGTLTLVGSPVVHLPEAPLPLGLYILATATGEISGTFASIPIFDSGTMIHGAKIHVVGNQVVLLVTPRGTMIRFY